MKHKGMKIPLSQDEKNEICEIIGDWYLEWKPKLIDWDERTHRLGYAKEMLKEMICGSPSDPVFECEHEWIAEQEKLPLASSLSEFIHAKHAIKCKHCGEFYYET